MKTPIRLLPLLLLTAPLAWAQPPAGGQMAGVKAYMQRLDGNGDGKLDRAEYLKPFEAQFTAMDKNKDGFVEEAEFAEFARLMRQRMMQRRQQQQTPGKP